MPPKSHESLDAPASPLPAGTESPRVMLVSGAVFARAQLRTWIDELCPECETEVLPNVYEATVRLVRAPAAVLVLDHEVDPTNVPEFVRHVARVAPATRVFVCTDTHRPPLSGSLDVLSWTECENALRRWFHRWRQAPLA